MPDLVSAISCDTDNTAGSPDSVAPTKIKKYTKSSPLKKPNTLRGSGDKFCDGGASTYRTTCFDAEAVQMILRI